MGHKQEKLGHKHEKLGHKQEKLGHKHEHEKLGHHSLKMIQMNCSATNSSDKNSPLTKVRPRKVRTRDATPQYQITKSEDLFVTDVNTILWIRVLFLTMSH